MSTETTTPDEPPIRVMALHALAYCERLFYFEEVEEIRVADAAVYAGRTLHVELQQEEEEKGTWSSRELCSQELGLTGKVDALRKRNGAWIPYEHKRGRARREEGEAVAWDTDILQVCAYAMLLEEDVGETIAEGRIRYHKDQVTVRVALTQERRVLVRDAVAQALVLRRSVERPPITAHDRRCLKCSLAPVCLPEEERLLSSPDWEPVRLFPPHPQRKDLHITEHGARICRSGLSLVVEGKEHKQKVPIHEVGALILHGYPQITTQALHSCVYHGVHIHWVTPGGKFIGTLGENHGRIQRRIRQFQALDDADRCHALARRLIHAKVENGLRYLLRLTRGKEAARQSIGRSIQTMRHCLRDISKSASVDSLRGHEGLAARAYFEALPSLLHPDVPEVLHPKGRSRRPPKDRFNALLSFGYGMLYRRVIQALHVVGLEPSLGFFHTPRSSAPPLVLDLMELFRVPVWEQALVASVNRFQWDPEEDFDIAGTRVWLSKPGRKKAIQLFERRMEDSWKHPVVKYSLSYARLIELEARLLEKEWTGSPGLFAKMRLR